MFSIRIIKQIIFILMIKQKKVHMIQKIIQTINLFKDLLATIFQNH